MRRRLRTLVTALAAAATATTLTAAVPRAHAAPWLCLSSADAIYTPPVSVTGDHGDLLACRPVTLSQVPGSIPMHAWQVQYVSTNVRGQKIAVTGTVAVPDAPWTGKGSRPLVAFNPGTLGLGPQCAFSKQLAGAYQDEYEGDQIAGFLKAGYAVAATDGVGYMNGQTHTYVVGANAGHALLDIVRTAFQVPFGGLDAKTAIGISGYSEGGAASLWAAQLAGSYAPELNVVAAAAGGVPGDLKITAAGLNRGPFAGFLADAVIGLSTAYPAMPFDSLLNSTGRDAVAKAKQLCLLGTVSQFALADISSYTTDHLTLDQIYALKGSDGATWGQVVDAQRLGVNIGPAGSGAAYAIGFPVFQYRGALEEVIPTATEDATRTAYCQAHITTQWKNDYPDDHLGTDGAAKDDVTKWLGDRFNGIPTAGNC